MADVSPTRTELLARRARISLAEQGRELLDGKRSALLREFNRLGSEGLRRMELLDERVAAAARELGRAIAIDGPETVASVARAAAGDLATPMGQRRVAGVELVDSDPETAGRPLAERGYALVTSTARIDRAAAAHEAVIDVLLESAIAERTLRRLASEIAATTRRMNALEHVVLPRLEAERDHIALVLEEREREDATRLRRAKRRRERTGAR
jgi:V/A-type H+-transporting ATPase subunit D